MSKNIFSVALCVLLLALSFSAEGQQPKKVPRIGVVLTNLLSANAAHIGAFQHGLRELGYVEGKNIVIEWRSADGKVDRLPELVAELVRLKVDVIVTGGSTATRPARCVARRCQPALCRKFHYACSVTKDDSDIRR